MRHTAQESSSCPMSSTSRHHKPRTRVPSMRALAALAFLAAGPAFSAADAVSPRLAAITAIPELPNELQELPIMTLVTDQRSPVWDEGHWTMLSHEENELRLRRRQDDEEDDEEEPSQTTVIQTAPGTTRSFTVSLGDGTSSTLATPSQQAPSRTSSSSTATETLKPLPSPFDSSMAFNFTTNDGSSCPTYMNDMLLSQTFKSCYPLSLLIQTSRSLFDSAKSLPDIVNVLDATCEADVDACTSYLNEKADNLTSSANCEEEFNQGHQIVTQAYYGLKAYRMLYSAGCLQDPESDMYCYARAVTNLTVPDNAYFYFLPFNMTLPRSASPSCSWCVQKTLDIFQTASADREQLISYTYESAAEQVNALCGPEFVNATLPDPVSSGAAPGVMKVPWATAAFTVLMAVAAGVVL